MEIWTAFLIGLLGSLHCVGMCGPIVLALPGGAESRGRFLLGRLLYNLGRVVTYAILGLVFGLIGKTIKLAGYQSILSIAMGVTIIIAVLLSGRLTSKLFSLPVISRLSTKIKSLWGKLFRIDSHPSLFTIGVMNGFLPCGFVYIGLFGAVTTGGSLSGAAYMIFFGLGTIPIMIGVSLIRELINFRFKQLINRFLPIGALILACLFILRGLSLGIPYVSPKITQQADNKIEVKCCDH